MGIAVKTIAISGLSDKQSALLAAARTGSEKVQAVGGDVRVGVAIELVGSETITSGASLWPCRSSACAKRALIPELVKLKSNNRLGDVTAMATFVQIGNWDITLLNSDRNCTACTRQFLEVKEEASGISYISGSSLGMVTICPLGELFPDTKISPAA
jgi:hypothetical protein